MRNLKIVTDSFIFSEEKEAIQEILLLYRDGKYSFLNATEKFNTEDFSSNNELHYLDTNYRIEKLIKALKLDLTLDEVIKHRNIQEIMLAEVEDSSKIASYIYLMTYFKLHMFEGECKGFNSYNQDMFCSFVHSVELEDSDILLKVSVSLSDIESQNSQKIALLSFDYYGYNNQDNTIYKIKSSDDIEKELKYQNDSFIYNLFEKSTEYLSAIQYIKTLGG